MNLNQFAFFLFSILFTSTILLNASTIDFTKNSDNILVQSELYVDKKNLSYESIQKQQFNENNESHINLGLNSSATLWLRLAFHNDSDVKVDKILQIRNPLLEQVILYNENSSIKKGTLNIKEPKDEIHTSFELTLNPKEIKTYYLEISNATTALRLGMHLIDELSLLKEEYTEETIIFIFFTILLLLLFYNIFLFMYTQEKVYLFYVFYLFSLAFQQATYLGITQMFLPVWFIYYDNLSVVLKINLMYITAILFAKSFLQTQKYIHINKIYNLILTLAIIEIPLFGTVWLYVPEVAIATALIFIYFNMYAGIYIYRQGYKEARLFVLGWILQLIGFTLMILDGLGVISTMNQLPSLIIVLTSLEALILSLAFIDRYIIFKSEKEKADAILLNELTDRQNIIEKEIKKATYELKQSLENEKNLLKELNHRTKNNLQLILSLVRMQSDTSSNETQNQFSDLESRINTIAKTHTMLYLGNNGEQIDMSEYIQELCSDLESLSPKNIRCKIEVQNLHMPIQLAGYIGLILNELVTNAIKHVLEQDIIVEIELYLKKEEYFLLLKDNGKEVHLDKHKSRGLGLKLVHTLVTNQLDGTLESKTENGLSYILRFKK